MKQCTSTTTRILVFHLIPALIGAVLYGIGTIYECFTPNDYNKASTIAGCLLLTLITGGYSWCSIYAYRKLLALRQEFTDVLNEPKRLEQLAPNS